MTSSKPKGRRHAARHVGAVAVGALLMLFTQTPVLASPDLHPPTRTGDVNLRLDGATATRLLAESQEADNEKPKTEEEKAKADEMKITVTKGGPGSTPAAASRSGEDKFAFAKDWPFWVIVGGVIIAGVATYMIVQNANQKKPCPVGFNAGCHGAQ